MNRMKEIEARMTVIKEEIEADGADLDALEKEVRSLKEERANIIDKAEKRKAMLDDIATGNIPTNVIVDNKEDRKMEKEKVFTVGSPEYRSAYLKTLMGKSIDEIEQRALTTAAGSAGGAVPTQTMNMIIDKLVQTSVLFGKIAVSYIAGNVSFVVANAKNDAAWKAEGANGTTADDTVVTVTLSGYELIKLVEISAAAKSMTIDAFESYIVAEIGRKMGIALENAILNGTGTGQPQGLLATGVITNTGTFTKVGMTYADVVTLFSKLPTMYHANACLVTNRDIFFKEIVGLVDTSKKPIVVQNVQEPLKFNVLGYPVIIDDYMPDDTIILGDLSYYKMNFSMAPSIESDKSAGFTSGKTIYRGLAVVDGKVALAEAFVKYTRAAA